EDLTLRGINLLDTPTRFTSLSDFAEGSRLAEILQELGVRIILPMKDSEHLLGFLALTSKAAGYRYTAEDFNLLGVLSNQMVGALTNARLYAVSLENARLQEEVNMARQIQLDLLPSSPPQLAVAHISALSTPSRTVGGDYYDFIEIDNDHRVGMVIGDASGKGLPAALLIAQIQAMMRSEINNGNPIPKMMANVNTQVALTTSSEKYVTLFYGELDTTTCEFKYANAGHNYPVLVRADGTVELLQAGGPIIGAFPRMEYSAATVKLDPDDLLFLFTDGLSEAMDTNNCEYTEERIRRWLVDHRNDDSDAIMKGILDDVYRFDPTTPPQDDTTVVAVKMKGGPLLRE
ncbi:MAG: SpoIIE family protein phosphatase, partial [candidate division Zixibacteria bacterium]|nr:SpoIIE family protein phosphatase [candidate division Zixibacteria bacterium]